MRKGIWEMLGELLRELALVVIALGFLERIFSKEGVTVASAAAVMGSALILWLSGAWIEHNRKE